MLYTTFDSNCWRYSGNFNSFGTYYVQKKLFQYNLAAWYGLEISRQKQSLFLKIRFQVQVKNVTSGNQKNPSS